MDSTILQKKIAEMKSRGGRNAVWKPDPGDYTIRIVPYKHNRDWPFIEMWFYYQLTNRTILSPYTFNRPDPIKEFSDSLYATGTEENKKLARILAPKRRIYAPVIIRGEEKEGVKFWGFAPKIYESLVLLMDDPDYGDITDPMEGHDIRITFEKPKPGSFNVPNVRVRPKSSPVTDSEEVLKLISDMVDITQQWAEPTYDELKEILDKFADENDDADEKPANGKVVAATQPNPKAGYDDDDDDVSVLKLKGGELPNFPANADDEDSDTQVDIRESFKKYFKQ